MRRFSKRDKVADLLKHAISNALLTKLEDERLRWITITGVQLSRDLSHAQIFYTFLEQQVDENGAKAALAGSSRELKKFLSENLRLRQFPELRFQFDEVEDRARRIDFLLGSIASESSAPVGGEDTGDE